jgi:hypothetical protein
VSIYFSLEERQSVFDMENVDETVIPEYESAGPNGPWRDIPGHRRFKSHNPRLIIKDGMVGRYIIPERPTDALKQTTGVKKEREFLIYKDTTGRDAAYKELTDVDMVYFDPTAPPEPLIPKHNPYLNEFGDYKDEYWTCDEFMMISKRVPEFLKQAGVSSISNATHGDHLAAQFEDYISLIYPEEWKKVKRISPYLDALQAWHEDHQNEDSE